MGTESTPQTTPTRRRFGALVLATAAGAALPVLQPTAAHAYTSTVSVRWGICSVMYNVWTNGGFGGGVRLNLPAHSTRSITLITRNSWGWQIKAKGMRSNTRWGNQYHVRFLDSKNRVVWTSYNAIPNGGRRKFTIGSNVRAIEVAAGPGRNGYGYYMTPVVGAGVAYLT